MLKASSPASLLALSALSCMMYRLLLTVSSVFMASEVSPECDALTSLRPHPIAHWLLIFQSTQIHTVLCWTLACHHASTTY